MKTEIKPSIKSGFFLNETEAVRIKDALNEQIKKLSGGKDADFDLQAKYYNGAVSAVESLDDLFKEENDGMLRLSGLTILAKNPENKEDVISVSFYDINNKNDSSNSPIRYSIESNNKDWSFVSSSIIEDRLAKIKTNKWTNYIIEGELTRWMSISVMSVAVILFAISFSGEASGRSDEIRKIHSSAKSLQDYVYQVDLIGTSGSRIMGWMPVVLIFTIIPMFFQVFFGDIVKSWYPNYTFYWGDNIKKYNRKMGSLKFVIVTVFLAIIIGLVVNYLSLKIF